MTVFVVVVVFTPVVLSVTELSLEEEADVTSRCMPFDGEPIADTCVCCGRAAKKLVYWGKAY